MAADSAPASCSVAVESLGEVIVGLQKAQGLPYRGLGNGRMGEQARELVMDVKLVKDKDVSLSRFLVPSLRNTVLTWDFRTGLIRNEHAMRTDGRLR